MAKRVAILSCWDRRKKVARRNFSANSCSPHCQKLILSRARCPGTFDWSALWSSLAARLHHLTWPGSPAWSLWSSPAAPAARPSAWPWTSWHPTRASLVDMASWRRPRGICTRTRGSPRLLFSRFASSHVFARFYLRHFGGFSWGLSIRLPQICFWSRERLGRPRKGSTRRHSPCQNFILIGLVS